MALIDFALITALTEEFRYMRALLPPAEEVSGGITWYRTRLQSDSGTNYEIVLAYQDKMGPLDALNLTRAVIDRWDPSHVILVGIAGSFQSWVRLGDVIVSQQVFYYDLAKATEGGLRYRPEGYPCGIQLIRQAHAISVDADETAAWQRAAAESARSKIPQLTLKSPARLAKAQSALNAHLPSIHAGTLASGSLVIADSSKREELLRLHGMLLGTEMEGAGLMHAAFFNEDGPKSAIIIKGVSDAADKDKAKTDAMQFWRGLAGENSVRLALAIIKRGRLRATLADQFDLDTELASAAEARRLIPTPTAPGVAFAAFPRLIRPKGPLSRLTISAALTSNDGPIHVLESRVAYHSKGNRVERQAEAGTQVTFVAEERIDHQPIGLYMMARSAPSVITLEVGSGSSRKSMQIRL